MESVILSQRSFARGEIGGLLHARADLDLYRAALGAAQNVVILPEGGVERRPGTRFIAEALESSRLLPFQFATTQAYIIEVGEKADTSKVIRVYRDGGIVETAPGSPVEIAGWIAAADLDAFDYTQTQDLLYVFHADYQPRKITRTSHTAWTVSAVEFTRGPFRQQNTNASISLRTSTAGEDNQDGAGAGGHTPGTTITLLAVGGDVFTADMVGMLIELTEEDGASVPVWEAGKTYPLDADLRWGGNVYKVTEKNAGISNGGDQPPTHLEGEAWDGSDNAGAGKFKYKYLHSGVGIVKITGYTDARTVTATVVTYLPAVMQAGSWKWALGAWNDYHGWPSVATFHQRRLWAAATVTDPNSFWASADDSFEEFEAGPDDTDAIAYRLVSDQVNAIRWIVPGKRVGIGTAGGEFAISASTTREAITPANIFADPESDDGSSMVRPVRIDKAPVYVDKSGRKINAFQYSFDVDGFVNDDLALLAKHITGATVKELAWQRDPYRILWVRLSDGSLASITYDESQNMRAWARHPMADATVERIAVMYAADGVDQELWMIVTRAINSVEKRFIERLEPFFQRGTKAIKDGWFLDCALQYDGGATTTISGLDHLEGETVSIIADGKRHADKAVSSGSITLDYSASTVLVGIAYHEDTYIDTLPVDRADVELRMRRKGPVGVVVDVMDTAALEVAGFAQDESTGAMVPATFEPIIFNPDLFELGTPELVTGLEDVDVESDIDYEGKIRVRSTGPYPFLIRAIFPTIRVADQEGGDG